MQELTEAELHQLLAGQLEEDIEVLQTVLLAMPQADIPVTHNYIDGMYTREITIPAGCMLISRVHKKTYIDIMVSGDIAVVTPEGNKRLTGFNLMAGVPGRKRAGYAYTETKWMTVHRIPEECANEEFYESMTFQTKQEYVMFKSEPPLLSAIGSN